MVKLSETPIDQTQFAVGVVDHDVVRLHVAVHDTLRVAVVESLEDLEHVVADVEVIEALVKLAEISIASVNKLSDDGGCLGKRISDDVDKLNNVDSVLKRLENLDLTSDFVLLNCKRVISGEQECKCAG